MSYERRFSDEFLFSAMSLLSRKAIAALASVYELWYKMWHSYVCVGTSKVIGKRFLDNSSEVIFFYIHSTSIFPWMCVCIYFICLSTYHLFKSARCSVKIVVTLCIVNCYISYIEQSLAQCRYNSVIINDYIHIFLC